MKFEDYFLTHIEHTELPIKIDMIEEKYGAKYLGDFCLKTRDGNWAESPAAIFWQPKPPVEGYSHFFGIIVRGGTVFITSGESAFSEPIVGIVADNGEVMYSRYRHDFRTSKDGTVSIDGGRDYIKVSGNVRNTHVHIIPIKGALKMVPIGALPSAPVPVEGVPQTPQVQKVTLHTTQLVDVLRQAGIGKHILNDQTGEELYEASLESLKDFADIVRQYDRIGTLQVLDEMKVWDNLQGDYQHVVEAIVDRKEEF